MEFEFHTNPFTHQRETFESSKQLETLAVFWEQGTGKTKLVIDTATWLYLNDEKINCLLVIAPAGVHRNWITDEIPTHLMPALQKTTKCFFYQTERSSTKWHQQAVKEAIHHKGLLVFTMTYNAVMTKRGRDVLWALLSQRKCFYTLDESSRIAKPGSKTGKRIVASGKYARYKRILDGTPVGHSPFDMYNQMRFIKHDFWQPFGLDSSALFKAHFGVWKTLERRDGATYDHLLGFQRLEELHDIIKYVSSRVTKDDVLDLPPKLYSKRYFELTPQQSKHYEELEANFRTWVGERVRCPMCEGRTYITTNDGNLECEVCHGDGEVSRAEVETEETIVRILRLHQITRGYLPGDPESDELYVIPGGNPCLESYVEWISQDDHKTGTWCRFTQDVDFVVDALQQMGRKVVRYDGKVSDDQRAKNKEAFQKGDAQDFVGNPAVGATGLTLHAGRRCAYYSQDYNYRYRRQSEDRFHRIGQTHPVLYADFLGLFQGRPTEDSNQIKNLLRKDHASAVVLGDKVKEWL